MSRRSTQGRGFLFADLRGYTAFVEARRDAAAAELLRTYRALVRAVIVRFDGAEIRTEGDSFYVVFPSATDAVLAGLAILTDAAKSSEGTPLRVGLGGEALIIWLYHGDPIMGESVREDGDGERLYRWWEDHARLLTPEPAS